MTKRSQHGCAAGGRRSYRSLVLSAAAAFLSLFAVGLPLQALADSEIVYVEEGPWPGDLTEVSPGDDAFAEEGRPGKGVRFLASVGSVVMSAVTFPVKAVIGVGGAVVGGFAGAMTGGNRDAAEGVWDVTTDGSYFITPEVLEGRKSFHLTEDEE